MKDYLDSLLDTILDREVSELFVAMMFALGLSLALSTLYPLLRRKAEDAGSVLAGLMMLACAVSATMAVAYVRLDDDREEITFGSTEARPGPRPGWEAQMALMYRGMVDDDGDGVVTEEELGRWNASMLRRGDRAGRGDRWGSRPRPDHRLDPYPLTPHTEPRTTDDPGSAKGPPEGGEDEPRQDAPQEGVAPMPLDSTP